MKSIDQQQSDLKNKLAPVFLTVLVLYLSASIFAEGALRNYLMSIGLGLGWVRLAVPLILCTPLTIVYMAILWFVRLQCPGCARMVRRPTYRALERLRQCPGCGCEWEATMAHRAHARDVSSPSSSSS